MARTLETLAITKDFPKHAKPNAQRDQWATHPRTPEQATSRNEAKTITKPSQGFVLKQVLDFRSIKNRRQQKQEHQPEEKTMKTKIVELIIAVSSGVEWRLQSLSKTLQMTKILQNNKKKR